MQQQADLVATGTVITMDGSNRVYRDGAVAVVGERIAAVGPRSEFLERYSAGRVIGNARSFVIPGLIDCHNHLAQALVRDFALEDLPNIYRVFIPSEMAMDADDARVSAQVMIAQLLRHGVTTLGETTCTRAHEDAIAETVMASGIRCAMARGQGDRRSEHAANYSQVASVSSFRDDPGKLADDLAECEAFLRKWTEQGQGRLRPWIHTMGLPACSDERFLRTRELAERFGTGFMTHINRDREEIELSMAFFGERPIEHLDSLGVLGPSFVAIHAMLSTDREIQMLARAGAKVAHSPAACTDVISAVTKVPTMRAAGVTVGLGCDTVINDILRVMGIAFLLHTASTGIALYDPVTFTTEDAFEMATREAARVLMWDSDIGSLETGKLADITVVDGDNVRLRPSHNPIGSLVQYGNGTDVDTVVVGGRIVVEGGKVLTLDEPAVLKEAEKLSARMADVLASRRYRPLTRRAVLC